MNNSYAFPSSGRFTAHAHSSPYGFYKRQSGFSLVELMIVIAIVGLLASIAMPSYSSFVMEKRRGDAHNLLQINGNRLTRCLTFAGTYDSDCKLLETSKEGHYNFVKHVTSESWELYAFPNADGKQANDTECRYISLNSVGVKGSSNANSFICW